MDKLLNPDTGLMIWTIVTFLCLVAILKIFAWGPLLGAIEAREGRLTADREGAERARAEAERIQKELEAQLAGVHARSKELLAAATKDGEALRARLKAEAEADAQAIKDKTMADLATEKNRLVGELRKETADIAVQAAEKLMRKTVDEGVRKTVLDGFFKDLESSKAETTKMQASDRVLAGRYASALFQTAAAKGEDQKVAADLGTARDLLLDATAALRHPRVSIADKKKLLRASLDGKTGATTIRFLELLIEKKRYDLFAMIAAVYGRLAADKRGVAKAHVRTAAPLSADAQKTLAARLKTFAGKDIELEIKEDPELIGGVAVKIGDWVLDSSLRGQLRRLRESFN